MERLCVIFISSSVQISCSIVSDSLQPREPQHTKPPWPSPTRGVRTNPRPLSQWCHPTISSSVIPFSPALNLSQHQGLCKWVSSLHQVAKVLEFQLQHQSTQDWSPLGWSGWISLQSKGLSRVFSSTTVKSINSLALSFLYGPTLTSIHDYWINQSLD